MNLLIFFSLQRAKRVLETLAFARGDVALSQLAEIREHATVITWREPRGVSDPTTPFALFLDVDAFLSRLEDKRGKMSGSERHLAKNSCLQPLAVGAINTRCLHSKQIATR